MKRSWAFVSILLMVVVVGSLEAAVVKPKVTVATYSAPRYEIMRNVLLPKWQAAHPDIEIEVQTFPDFWNKMLLLMGTNQAPDIIDTAGTYLFGHVIRNGAVDLAPYITRDRTFSKENFWAGPWNEVRWPQPDGSGIFALPYDTVGTLLWFNRDLLASAGVNTPTANWTWNDLRTASRRVAQDINGDGVNEVWGLSLDLTHLTFDPLVRSFGGKILNPDRKSAGIDLPQAAEATRFMADLILQDRSAALGASFVDSKAAFQIQGSYAISTVGLKEGLNWGVSVVPSGPAARNAYGGSNMWEVIRRPGQDMDAILVMLRELLTQETIEAFWVSYVMPYSIPSVRSVAGRMRPSVLQTALLESSQYMSDPDWTPDWALWQTAKRNGIDPVMRGQRSVQEGLSLAKKGIDDVLNNAYGQSR